MPHHPFPAALWEEARPAVEAYCCRATSNRADADDLVQAVAIRAWLGYPRFRGDSSFRTWVLRIAAREAARHGQRRVARLRRELPLDADGHDLPAPPATEPLHAGTDLGILACARRAGDITEAEHRVVLARLAAPHREWAELATTLGVGAGAGAVAHCRAVPKIRVHAFVHHPEVLGGPAAIRTAFAAVRSGGRADGAALTDAQAEAFMAVVVEGRTAYRRRGWQTALRVACAVVVARLPVPETTGPGAETGAAIGNASRGPGSIPVRA